MKIYKKSIFAILFCLISVFSCKPEFEYDKITDIYIFSTVSSSNDLVTTIGKSYSFTDASRGEYVREWTVNGPSFFTNNGDSVLTEHIAHVQFKETGIVPVKVTLDFGDPSLNYDTTFNVAVFDSVVTADFEVANIEGDFKETNGKYTIESGTFITFKSTSEGFPDVFEWNADVNGEFKDSLARMEFVTPGTYDVTLTASRKEPISGKKGEITKTALIEVVPSSIPYVLDQLTQDANGNIFVKLNRDLNVDEINDNTINNFKVTDALGEVQTINHLTVSNELNNTIILFVDPNFSSLFVTYKQANQSGDIISVDGVLLEEFTDVKVEGYQHNFFTNGSFENGTYAPFNDGKWIGSGGMKVLKDPSIAVDGDYFLAVNFDPYTHKNGNGSKLSIEMTDDYFPISTEKKYTFEFYAKAIGNIRTLKVSIKDQESGNSVNKSLHSNLIDGEWVKITWYSNESIPKDFIQAYIQFDLIAEPDETAQLLIDHMVFTEHVE